MTISFEDFSKVEIRIGTIIEVKNFPEALKPAYKIWVDFGCDIGIRKTSAQITVHYQPESLVGRQVAGVINFSPKQIGNFMSEILLLGFPDSNGEVVLIGVDHSIPNGGRLF
jgi:tRNA-binding protein